MFKEGEKIVCIKKINMGEHKDFIKIGNMYTFEYYRTDKFWNDKDEKCNMISIAEDTFSYHSSDYFMSLKEYRKRKINNICSKLEIK